LETLNNDMNITRLIAQAYSKMISESHTAKEIASTPSKELRGLADTYSKKISVVREKAVKAKEAGNHEEAAKLHKQADAHQDEEMNIRDELRRRLGMR
jgi:hypothetical protein